MEITDDNYLSAAELHQKYSSNGEGEHPKFSRWDWVQMVCQRSTIIGYWEWVRCMLQDDHSYKDASGVTPKLPTNCDGLEQVAFETWAKGERYDMGCHPLFYIFLNERTNAARMGWNAAIKYVNRVMAGEQPKEDPPKEDPPKEDPPKEDPPKAATVTKGDFPYEEIRKPPNGDYFDNPDEAIALGFDMDQIWSVVIGEDNSATYGPAHHYVNVIGYVATKERHNYSTYYEEEGDMYSGEEAP